MGAMAGGVATRGTHGRTHVVPSTARAHQHHQSSDKNDGKCCCSCVGDCSISGQLATIPPQAVIRVAVARATAIRVSPIAAPRAMPEAPDGLLPFANGPPHLAAV
jgi:hypothetical protein